VIIVTGAAGFIGSNLVHGLNRAGFEDIILVDSLSDSAKHLNLRDARFIDYFDKEEFLAELPGLQQVDAVFHQGACAVTTEQDGRYMMENNFTYSRKVLHHCMDRRIPFIYASSAAVYGNGEETFSELGSPERPLNIYGFSKLVFEQHVRKILPDATSPVIGLRYFNVYGPRESHKGNMSSVIYKMTERHRRGQPLQLFRGSDGFLRDFIHVDDVVDVNLFFLQSGKSGIYNCGSGTARSFQELGDLVAEKLAGAKIEMIDMPPSLVRQYQKFTCSDNTLLRGAGYNKDFRGLARGIEEYIGWLTMEAPFSLPN